jgi:hypothetical protein
MLGLRMLMVAWRLSWPYTLTPWRSPLLRWRMETFGIQGPDGRLLHAEDLDACTVLRFTFQHRRALARFLRWAAML